jgi:hypothetical protein
MDTLQSSLQALLPKPSTRAAPPAAIPSSMAANAGLAMASLTKQHAAPHQTPWNPSEYQLWVERGVVWDLKQTQVLGFIDYAAIQPYFAPTKFKPNKEMFTGSPFSLNDFPVYGYLGAYYSALVFSALHMLSYIPDAWNLFRSQGLTNGTTAPPAGAGPAASARDMGLFLAGSPSGTKTFSAKYVAYMYRIKPAFQPWWPPS